MGSQPVQVRAMDDSANIGGQATPRLHRQPARAASSATSCPRPRPANDADAVLELGLRFTPTADGFVTGVRFYKGTGNTGTHIGIAVEHRGQRLARASRSPASRRPAGRR